jgi:hypothetical protein
MMTARPGLSPLRHFPCNMYSFFVFLGGKNAKNLAFLGGKNAKNLAFLGGKNAKSG